MKTIIAGGRDYYFTKQDKERLNLMKMGISEVVSGDATGADLEGAAWALKNKIPVKHFPAKWKTYGKRAGYLRNCQMAEYAEAVILFPGGKGTQHMFDIAKKLGLIIHDFRDPNSLF